MKNQNAAILSIASSVLLSLSSFSAFADTSAPAALQEKIQSNAGKQIAAEGNKYAQIAALAGNKGEELTARKYEAANAYKSLRNLQSAVVKHYPSHRDYTAVEMASNEYARAHKAFVELQKSILAQNGFPIHNVARRIIALE